MKFIQYLKSTIFGPTLYHEVAFSGPGKVLLHAGVLIVVFAAAITIAVSPYAYKVVDKLQELASAKYPEGLVLNIKDGVLSSNSLKPIVMEDKDGKPALVIDTSVLFTGYEQLDTYDTRGLVTKDFIVMRRGEKDTVLLSMSQFEDREITKGNIDSILMKLKDGLPVVSLLTFFSLCILGAVLGLIYYLFLGLILKLMALVFDKEHVTWIHGTRIGILASTLPVIVVSVILAIFGAVFPFLITFIPLVIASVNRHAFHKQYTQTQLPL